MMLIEETTVPDAALPVDQFKAHLRQGTGFGEEDLQDAVLKGFLRAAFSAIEARTGKALITRSFSWVLTGWRNFDSQVLPIAPVLGVTQLTSTDAQDTETVLPSEQVRLEKDTHRPRLRAKGLALPTIPTGGSIKITFDAGLASDWDGLPSDLGQAVLLLAAHYYEYRNDTGLSDGCTPFGVTSLIQRYRPMRISPEYGK